MLVGAPKQLVSLLARLLGTLIMPRIGGGRRIVLMAKGRQADLVALKELVEAGRLSPVIDRTYPLSAVAEALRYFGTGRVGGKVVISIP